MTIEDASFKPELAVENPSYHLHPFEYDDPFVSDQLVLINEQVEELTRLGYKGDTNIVHAITRKRKAHIKQDNTPGELAGPIYDNPATQELVRRMPTVEHWLDLVPSAAALDALYKPDEQTLLNGKPVSTEQTEWLRNLVDARGIRSRGAVVDQLLMTETLSLDYDPKWLSLAAGAAQPIIATAAYLQQEYGIQPLVTLADFDEKALSTGNKYASEVGLDEYIHTKQMNILYRKGLTGNYTESYLGFAIDSLGSTAKAMIKHEKYVPRRRFEGLSQGADASYDVVEAVGFLEYLQPEDWDKSYEYGTIKVRTRVAGARTFLQNAYKLVRPGGILVLGNMLDTHPQLGFTLNVIQWPHIQPRSIDEMVQLLQEAGIDGELDIYTPSDGAYAVYAARKPKSP